MKFLGLEIKKAKDTVNKNSNTTSTTTLSYDKLSLLRSYYASYYYTNYSLFSNTAQWHQLSGIQSLFEIYLNNPVLRAVIDIKARESANMKIVIENINTNTIEPENTRKAIPAKLYKLFSKPNPLKSSMDFWYERKILRDVAGMSFTYANFPFSFGKSPDNIRTLFNVWPAYMEFQLGKSYFEATELSDIIKQWKFNLGTYKKEWEPNEILFQSEPNINPTNDRLILGISKIFSLIKPLTNIALAYESRNVIIKQRGMRGVMSSGKSDDSGTIPLLPEEKKVVQEELQKYGTLEDQMQWFFSHVPLNVTSIDQDVRKLGLFEEIASDGMIVANLYGVPEILLKLYLEGTTFENQESSLRRLYQGTLMPEAENDLMAMNEFIGLNETEWRIKGYWDHIPSLQKSEKEKAESNQRISIYSERLFRAGALTLNTWLDSIGLQKVKAPYGDQTILEMDEQTRTIILDSMGKSGSSSSADSNADANSSGNNAKSMNGSLKPILN